MSKFGRPAAKRQLLLQARSLKKQISSITADLDTKRGASKVIGARQRPHKSSRKHGHRTKHSQRDHIDSSSLEDSEDEHCEKSRGACPPLSTKYEKCDDASRARPMTCSEQRNLVAMVEELQDNADAVATILHMIETGCPEAISLTPDDAELHFEKLNTPTARDVEAYVQSILSRKRRRGNDSRPKDAKRMHSMPSHTASYFSHQHTNDHEQRPPSPQLDFSLLFSTEDSFIHAPCEVFSGHDPRTGVFSLSSNSDDDYDTLLWNYTQNHSIDREMPPHCIPITFD